MAKDRRPALSCQQCRNPIDIDASIDQLNPAAFKLLTDSTVPGQQQIAKHTPTRQSRPTYPSSRQQTYEAAIQSARNPTFRRNVPPSRHGQHGAQNTAMSFINVDVSESMMATPSSPPGASRTPERPASAQSTAPELTRRASAAGNSGSIGGGSLADALETTNRMFEILSSRSDIDHPICVECTELLIEGLGKRLAVAVKERDAYVHYLRVANTDVPSGEEIKAAETALKQAKKAETKALAELEKLEAQKAELDAALADEEVQARACDKEESAFWQDRNAFAITLNEFQSERDALLVKHAHDTEVLRQLQRRSVYNDTFNITHDNHFATINGLRLGRLNNPYVDWPELNAAWGQTCLLLATLAERLQFKFSGYELCPMGSTSTIIRLEHKPGPSTADARNASSPSVSRHKLELYSSGDFPINFGFTHRKIDAAMVAFLECLRQLGEFVEAQGPHTAGGLGGVGNGGGGMSLPYAIRKDKIHDQSIKLSVSKDEAWTKACKYTLTCCKFLLAHANNVESSAVRRGR
ncbi:Vacuolar protein sorting-associated protein atg6 [Didymosphaeria variabile]|uniref:Vacuolar protein sorting-associated protein atg6 n=1 Tax=Didymosphaeria variabile TaxID=1932322 RepID=A0A9W9C6D7_9PLEO|nr:Vacuolar protein sorting-associated protein atg6 [Didymosphaeria variabile]KAJ4345273.1 Vacuolar protein sorting-associated protein atg6 [Didymosphaeria variabile]